LDADYTKRKQNNTNNDGNNHSVETIIGAITPWDLNPFIRYYDENIQGTSVNSNVNTTSSWGPGMRWLASPHIIIDLSYNFVADDTVSDDYLDTSIEWEPSARTSLTLGYSQRFFGDSYNIAFKHKTKRLTNSITYDERRFAWSSQLQLSRTSFNVTASTNERKSLTTNVVDDTLDTSISVTRTISPKSSLSLSAAFNYKAYDKDNPLGSRQEDYYRTISTSFTRNLASSLSCGFTVKHVNRDSTIDQFSYNELRATINITKEF